MKRTRGEAWFFAILGFTGALIQLLMVRGTLWPRLGALDWFTLVMLLVAPVLALRQHLRSIREMDDEAWNIAFRFVMGGYVPLWFGFILVRRVLN